MAARRQFSREFKLEAVKLVKARGVSVAQAARDLALHQTVLRSWIRELATPALLYRGACTRQIETLDDSCQSDAVLQFGQVALSNAALPVSGPRLATTPGRTFDCSDLRTPPGDPYAQPSTLRRCRQRCGCGRCVDAIPPQPCHCSGFASLILDQHARGQRVIV